MSDAPIIILDPGHGGIIGLQSQWLEGTLSLGGSDPMRAKFWLNAGQNLQTSVSPPVAIHPSEQDMLMAHTVKRKLSGLARRLDPRLEEAALACCRRDSLWYSMELELEVCVSRGDQLMVLGLGESLAAASVLLSPVFDKSLSGSHIKHGGVVIDQDDKDIAGWYEYFTLKNWTRKEHLGSNPWESRVNIWMPPEDKCEGCDKILACRGLRIS